MAGSIYDEQGICVARIIDGTVRSEISQRTIRTERDQAIFSLGGNLLGYLEIACSATARSNAQAAEFFRLASEA